MNRLIRIHVYADKELETETDSDREQFLFILTEKPTGPELHGFVEPTVYTGSHFDMLL